MKIGITGVTGLIGKALAAEGHSRGHSIIGFSRNAHRALPYCESVRIFSLQTPVDLNGLDAIIHLAGESVIGFWTREKRRRIVASRRDTTRHLVSSMAEASVRPEAFLCISGTGYYGDRGAEILHENSGHGTGFLSEVTQVWEEEAAAAQAFGVRTCQLRTGMVLAKNGGAFPMLRRVFSLGLGGMIGNGQQYLPWIHVKDLARLFFHCLENTGVNGPLNAVAPDEITNLRFTQTLGATLHRPTFLPVPGLFLKTILGELSGIMLDSQRVMPSTALAAGFSFEFQTIQQAVEDLVS